MHLIEATQKYNEGDKFGRTQAPTTNSNVGVDAENGSCYEGIMMIQKRMRMLIEAESKRT